MVGGYDELSLQCLQYNANRVEILLELPHSKAKYTAWCWTVVCVDFVYGCVFPFWCGVSGAGFFFGFFSDFSPSGFFLPLWMLGSILLNLCCVCVTPASCCLCVGIM